MSTDSNKSKNVNLSTGAYTIDSRIPDLESDLDYGKFKQNILASAKGGQNKFRYSFLPSLIASSNNISKAIRKKKEEIENDDLEQNIKLKKHTLYALFGFLIVETILIFCYSFFQATHAFGFNLEEWSFKLLVAATISQITYMVQVAVKHLFPAK